jgi:hypothetical protein
MRKQAHVPPRDPITIATCTPFRIHVGGKVILPLRDGSLNLPQIVTIKDAAGVEIPHKVVDAGPGWAYIQRM